MDRLDQEDLLSLAQFFKEAGLGRVKEIKRLQSQHWTGKSFFVELYPDSRNLSNRLFLKVYSGTKRKYCAQEIGNLRFVESLSGHLADSIVRTPELFWADVAHGLIATKWISGVDLDSAIKAAGRLWSREDPAAYLEDIRSLLNWLIRFAELGEGRALPPQTVRLESKTWDRWFSWLQNTSQFDPSWTNETVSKLALLRKNFENRSHSRWPVHGDFAHWNVRCDPHGSLWVLDWTMLDRGHWLEAAYRFYYALRVSSASPFGKPEYYQSLLTGTHRYIWERESEWQCHQYYRIRSLMWHFFSQCRHPANGFRNKVRQRYLRTYWMKELDSQLAETGHA